MGPAVETAETRCASDFWRVEGGPGLLPFSVCGWEELQLCGAQWVTEWVVNTVRWVSEISSWDEMGESLKCDRPLVCKRVTIYC